LRHAHARPCGDFGTRAGAVALATFFVAAGCGGDAGPTSTGGAPGQNTGGAQASGGGTGTGGAPTGGAGMTGGAGTGGNGEVTGGCPDRRNYTEAAHAVLEVTWPAGAGSLAGRGEAHIWTKTALTVNGNAISGQLQICGSVLPATMLAASLGNASILMDIPDAAWDAPSMATYLVTGTQTGVGIGASLSESYVVLTGFEMPDAATAAWPASYSAITMTRDPDGDALPGLTAIPRKGGAYILPPTSAVGAALGLGADKVSLISRSVVSHQVTRTSCDEAAGTATFKHFDNHIVGCHLSAGAACAPADVMFLDDNRPIYTVESATVKAKVVADAATCAEIRAAFSP
jgi:hypothetical protein